MSDSIFLRPISVSDVNETYVAWLNDPDINQYLETRFEEQTKERIHAYVEAVTASKDYYFFAICSNENGRHIGNIKLGPIDIHHGFAEVSLLIGEKEFWGKGIATRSIQMVSYFAFSHLGLNKLRAGCYENNTGSMKAFKKAGYEQEGILRKMYRFDDRYINGLLFGLLKEDALFPETMTINTME